MMVVQYELVQFTEYYSTRMYMYGACLMHYLNYVVNAHLNSLSKYIT
jgi:hypothetical protein